MEENDSNSEQGEVKPTPAIPFGLAGRRPGWDIPPLHKGLHLAPSEALAGLTGRTKCPECGQPRCYFCYDCLIPFTSVPEVELPFNLWIITHPGQLRSNASGVHLALLSPKQVKFCSSVDDLPSSLFAGDCPSAAILYPDATAFTTDQLLSAASASSAAAAAVGCSAESPAGARTGVAASEENEVAGARSALTDVVVVDSLWSHSVRIMADDRMRRLRHVRIRSYRTAFWRFHTRGVPEDGLCTVEAVFFLCREMHDAMRAHGGSAGGGAAVGEEARERADGAAERAEGRECHCFDNLLWYFAFQWHRIHRESRGRVVGGKFTPPVDLRLTRSERRTQRRQQQRAEEGSAAAGSRGESHAARDVAGEAEEEQLSRLEL